MKKIAFITHSYHKKSRSVSMLADEIFGMEKVKIDFFYVEDWSVHSKGLREPIVGYDVVLIVQLISLEILNKIQCDNIIFMPMYDFSYAWDVFKWLECVNLKILSSTKRLHDALCQMGFNSYYFKYYPEPDEFMPGDLKEVFLWQRINNINIQTTIKLLKDFQIEKIHLHRSPDPGHVFLAPSETEVAQYKITFSDWFEDKQDYLDRLKQSGIYIAPRLMEGGGAAFIDAMKMGKVVIANNDAAMDEYIVHGESGLLYDAQDPEPLDFEGVDFFKIQKNAYESVQEGRTKFKRSIPAILDFIQSKHNQLIPNDLLKVIRTSRESLREEHHALMQRFIEVENVLKYDCWYNLGKLSRKDKIKSIFSFFLKRVLGNVPEVSAGAKKQETEVKSRVD